MALVADDGYSLSDLISEFVTLWSMRLDRLPLNNDHASRQQSCLRTRKNSVGGLMRALLLVGTGVSVGTVSGKQLWRVLWLGNIHHGVDVGAMAHTHTLPPTFPAFLTAGLSVLAKEWLFRITRKVAMMTSGNGEQTTTSSSTSASSQLNPVVMANAWHHRSDAYSSVLAAASVALSMTVPSLLCLDAAAGVLVAGTIFSTGLELCVEATNQLTDTNDQDLVRCVVEAASGITDVSSQSPPRVRTRRMGSNGSIVDVALTTCFDGLSGSALQSVEERVKHAIVKEANRQGYHLLAVHAHATSPSAPTCPLLISTVLDSEKKQEDEEKTKTGEIWRHQEEHEYGHDHDHDVSLPNTTSSSPSTPKSTPRSSFTEGAHAVEHFATHRLLGHPDVLSVERCTVHYKDTIRVHVDANLRLRRPDTLTVAQATTLARDLRKLLEKPAKTTTMVLYPEENKTNKNDVHNHHHMGVDKANIYLDLNHDGDIV